jgi:hypothetical protein
MSNLKIAEVLWLIVGAPEELEFLQGLKKFSGYRKDRHRYRKQKWDRL